MKVGGNTETGHFFQAAWNIINSDHCLNCFTGLRLVKACVVRVCCPRPSENYPTDLRQPLLTGTEQGNVTDQSCPNRNSEMSVVVVEPEYLAIDLSVRYESLPPLSTPDVTILNEQLLEK